MEGINLRRLIDDHQFFHDGFQLERFIVAGHGWTPWCAYKQCLREVRTRLEGLKAEYRQIRAIQIELEDFEFHDRDNMNKLQRERFKLAWEAKLLELETVQATARDRAREFSYFAAQADAIRESLGEITPERRAELDVEGWVQRLRAQAAAELCAMGHVTLGTMSAIRLLPQEPRVALIGQLRVPETREALISWWQTFEPNLPAPTKTIPVDEVEALITCQSESPQLS